MGYPIPTNRLAADEQKKAHKNPPYSYKPYGEFIVLRHTPIPRNPFFAPILYLGIGAVGANNFVAGCFFKRFLT